VVPRVGRDKKGGEFRRQGAEERESRRPKWKGEGEEENG